MHPGLALQVCDKVAALKPERPKVAEPPSQLHEQQHVKGLEDLGRRLQGVGQSRGKCLEWP